jgi:hypothetical protein
MHPHHEGIERSEEGADERDTRAAGEPADSELPIRMPPGNRLVGRGFEGVATGGGNAPAHVTVRPRPGLPRYSDWPRRKHRSPSSSPRPRRGRFRRPLGLGRCSSRRASVEKNHTLPKLGGERATFSLARGVLRPLGLPASVSLVIGSAGVARQLGEDFPREGFVRAAIERHFAACERVEAGFARPRPAP